MPFWFIDVVLWIVFSTVLVGAAVLWFKTRHPAVLVQLIASALVIVLRALEQLASYRIRSGRPQLYDAIHTENLLLVGQLAFMLCFLAFPVGYLWYAVGQKRI